MQWKPLLLIPTLAAAAALAACGNSSTTSPTGPQTHTFSMTAEQLVPVWTVSKAQDVSCGGQGKAGGLLGGTATFTELGQSQVQVSAAWDVSNLIQTTPQYTPSGPAGGPVAPVLGQSQYPYTFAFDPNTQTCGQTVTATGQVKLTANAGTVSGEVTGGEAFRLDFSAPGDGVETFAKVNVTGGTGQFAGATGSFVVHTIIQFDASTMSFKVTMAEIMPGGTLQY